MSELIINNTSFLRVWVNTESYPRDIYKGFRHLKDREIHEYQGGNDWKILFSNKSCMRNIEVMVLDEAYRRLI